MVQKKNAGKNLEKKKHAKQRLIIQNIHENWVKKQNTGNGKKYYEMLKTEKLQKSRKHAENWEKFLKFEKMLKLEKRLKLKKMQKK